MIAYLVINNMFYTFSLDLYLPALPSMGQLLAASSSLVNLTLSVFILAYAGSSFLWGPLSDKYGRRPCLLAGAAVYTLGSLLCALCRSVYLLIVCRALEGVGAGAILCVSLAVVRDCYEGSIRERVLALVYTASSVAMLIAPILGAQLLRFYSWQAPFCVLTALGMLSLLLSIRFEETQPSRERQAGSLFGGLKKYGLLCRNKPFVCLTLIFAASNLPFMGYIALSSYIYIDYFGLSEQAYSLYFALCSLFFLSGPTIYMKCFTTRPKKQLGSGFFILCALSGLLVAAFGRFSPPFFWLSILPFVILYAAVYTYYMTLLLEQHQGDTGLASSAINAVVTIMGSVGALLASLLRGDIVIGLGLLIVIFSLLPYAAWLLFLRSAIPTKGLKS